MSLQLAKAWASGLVVIVLAAMARARIAGKTLSWPDVPTKSYGMVYDHERLHCGELL